MLKVLMIAIAFLLTSGSAEAISRYNSKSLSCANAKSLVKRQGAVIYRYPSKRNASLILYDRFVAHGGKCAYGETAAVKGIPTRSGSCRLLYCRPSTDRGGSRRRNNNGTNWNVPIFNNPILN